MAILTDAAKAIIQDKFSFLGSIPSTSPTAGPSELDFLIQVIQESDTLTSQFNEFTSALYNGQITFGSSNTQYTAGDILVSHNPTTYAVDILLPSMQPTVTSQVNPFASNQNGSLDSVVGNIVGALAHELGHFENAIKPIYSMDTANPGFAGLDKTPINQARMLADELLSEGIGLYNNTIVASEIAANSGGQTMIGFFGGTTAFEQSLFDDSNVAHAVTTAAEEVASIRPSVGSSPTYLTNYWQKWAPPVDPVLAANGISSGLQENMADIASVDISTNASGVATKLILQHSGINHTTGASYSYISSIDFSQESGVTDTWIDASNHVLRTQSFSGTSAVTAVNVASIASTELPSMEMSLGNDSVLSYLVNADGSKTFISTNLVTNTTNDLLNYTGQISADDILSFFSNEDGTFSFDSVIGENDYIEVASEDVILGEEQNFTFIGNYGTLAIAASTQGGLETNYNVDSTSTADLTTDSIEFAGHSLAQYIGSGLTDNYGREYTLDGATLVVTSGNDFLTINDFHNGDFGVDFAPQVTVPGAQTVAQGTMAHIAGVSISSADSASDIITTTLTDTNGILSVSGNGGTITGSGTNQLTITGTQAQINADLATLSYVDFSSGSDTINVTTNDGHGGSNSKQVTVKSLGNNNPSGNGNGQGGFFIPVGTYEAIVGEVDITGATGISVSGYFGFEVTSSDSVVITGANITITDSRYTYSGIYAHGSTGLAYGNIDNANQTIGFSFALDWSGPMSILGYGYFSPDISLSGLYSGTAPLIVPNESSIGLPDLSDMQQIPQYPLVTGGDLLIAKIGTASLENITNPTGSTYTNSNGMTTTLSGNNTNNGTLLLASTGDATQLQISGNTTLSGSGIVQMSNFTQNSITGTGSNDSLTIGTGQTVQGSGSIGGNGLSLTNQGTILANQSTTLNITSAITNDGLMAASGATLDVHGAVTGTGRFSIGDPSTVEFDSSVSSGQTVSMDGEGAQLVLNDATEFAATITGFTPGMDKTIDLKNITLGTKGVYLTNGNVLTVQESNGNLISLQLDPNQDYSNDYFSTAGDGNGGIDVAVNNPIEVSGTGNVYTINNAKINITNEAQAAVNGSYNAISLSDNDILNLQGMANTVTVTGASDTVDISSSANGAVAGYVVTFDANGNEIVALTGGDTVTVDHGIQATIIGSDGTLIADNNADGHIQNIINWNAGGSQVQVLTGAATGVTETVTNYTGANGTGTATLIQQNTTLADGSSRVVLYNPSSTVNTVTRYYSGANGSGTLTKELTNYTDGTSQIEWFNTSATVLTSTKHYTGANGTGTLVSQLIDYTDGTSRKILFSGLPNGISQQTLYYSGADATGVLTKQLTDYTDGTSQIASFNPSATVISSTKYYSAADGTGTLTSQLVDYTDGTSKKTLFTGLPSGISQQSLYYSGADATGTLTKQLTDYTDGTSQIKWFNPSSTISSHTKYYNGLDGSGVLASEEYEMTDGSSREYLYTNLASGVTAQKLFYSGAGLTGNLTRQITDYTDGTSQVEYPNPSSAVTDEIRYYSGTDGSGTLLHETQNLSAGGSKNLVFAGLASSETEEILYYSGANLTGTLTREVIDYSDGTSAKETFKTNTNGSTTTTVTGYSGTNLGGTQTYLETINTDSSGHVSMNASGAGAKINLSGATVTLAAGSSAAVIGSNDTITLASNDTLSLSGNGNHVAINGSATSVNDNSASQNSPITLNGVSNTVTLSGYMDTVTENGGGNNITLNGANASITDTGTGNDTIALNGTGEWADIAGNGDNIHLSGVQTSVAITGSNETVMATGSYATVTDNGTGNNTIRLNGTNEAANIAGNNDIIMLSGFQSSAVITGGYENVTLTGKRTSITDSGIGNDTITINAIGASAYLYGNNDTLITSSYADVTLTGTGESLTFTDTSGNVTVDDGASTTGDTITFDGQSIAGTLYAEDIGSKYALNGTTLTVTSGSDILTINNFHSGDFGVNISTVPAYTVTTFSAPGMSRTLPFAINAGEIFGRVPTGMFADNNGTFTFFGASNTEALGANNTGIIVGYSFNNDGTEDGLIDNNGTITSLDYPNASSTVLQSVNDAGEIVGWTISNTDNENHGLIDIGGTLTNYDIAGAAWTILTGINNNGVLVGAYGLTDNDEEGFIDDHGVITTLNFPGTTGVTLIDGINDANEVVGTYIDAQGSPHSFVYHNGVYTPIAVNPADGTVTVANGINNAGQVVGYYTSNNGSRQGFLANPTADVNLVNATNSSLTVADATVKTISGNGNTIVGGTNDTITLYGNGNTLSAANGSVLAAEGTGNIYQFTTGGGSETIHNGIANNNVPSNELVLGSGVTKDQLWFEQVGNNLQVDILGTADHMTIANWYSNSYAQLSDIRTAGGNVIDSQLAQLVQTMATYSANHTGFNPATATAMPTDLTLQNTLAASWH